MGIAQQCPASKAMREVQSHAEQIRNDDAHMIEVMDVGDMWTQGDVGLLRIAGVPRDAVQIDNPQSQLAPGSTQGSRHCLRSLSGMTMWRVADPTPLDGPIIEAREAFAVEHPEHGDVTLPAGTYAVVYQRAYAGELRRVED